MNRLWWWVNSVSRFSSAQTSSTLRPVLMLLRQFLIRLEDVMQVSVLFCCLSRMNVCSSTDLSVSRGQNTACWKCLRSCVRGQTGQRGQRGQRVDMVRGQNQRTKHRLYRAGHFGKNEWIRRAGGRCSECLSIRDAAEIIYRDIFPLTSYLQPGL